MVVLAEGPATAVEVAAGVGGTIGFEGVSKMSRRMSQNRERESRNGRGQRVCVCVRV